MTASELHAQASTYDWKRPVRDGDAQRWGHPHGIQVAIDPNQHPRGPIRVHAPYLDHPDDHLVNFIEIEPIARGWVERGYSEMEASTWNPGQQGKRFWSADTQEQAPSPRPPRLMA